MDKLEEDNNFCWEQIQRGDNRAFERLFELYYLRLCSYAEYLVKDKVVGEDIAQSIFINLWTKREQLELKGTIEAYMYRMVYNASMSSIKYNQRNVVLSPLLEMSASCSENWIDSFIDNESYLLLMKHIEMAIESLPLQTRQIFRLSRIEGKKSNEIADMLGLSTRTVENHLYRALKRLKEKLSYLDNTSMLFYILLGSN